MIIVKWMKKWSFLILLTGVGIVYLTAVDHWQVYAESFDRTKMFCQRMLYGAPAFPGNIVESSGGGAANGTFADGVGTVAAGNGNDGDSETLVSQSGADQSREEDGNPSSQDGKDSHGTEDGFWDGSDPVYMTVEDDYFSDAVFIGDSRMVGLYEYGGLEEVAAFYASKGLTVYKLFDAEIVKVPGQRQNLTIEDALLNNEFKKIYLMVGINEMGTGTVETFTAKYKEVADHLLELQPNAILYIQGILKVTTERSKQGDYINNEGIVARNEALSGLADNRRIFYLDANPVICDDTGGVVSSYTTDGVHLKAQYIQLWKDYLKEHAIDLGE